MRWLFLFVAAAVLAGCNSPGSRDVANAQYAADSYEQSAAAYRMCAAQNASDPQKCDALAHVMEADKKRYEATARN